MRRPAASAIGLATLAAAGPARAAGEANEPIALVWAAVPGCPGEREVRAGIERVLAGPPSPASRRYLRAEATVSRAGGGFHLHLITDLGGTVGEREFDGPTCAAVADAAALIVALTFDPEALSRRAEAAPGPPSTPPSPTLPTGPAPRPAPVAPLPESAILPVPLPDPGPVAPSFGAGPAPRPRPALAVGVIGSATVGALPEVGGALGGRVGVVAGRFRADVSASYWLDRTATLATRPTAGGRIHLVAGDARACWAIVRTPAEVSPCLGLEVGSMGATGFGVQADGSGSAPWIAPVAEVSAALPVGRRFAARLDVGVLVPAERPPFVLTSAGTVYTAGPVVGRAVLGLEVRF